MKAGSSETGNCESELSVMHRNNKDLLRAAEKGKDSF